MKRTNRIPSYLAMVAALAVIRLPILVGPATWRERLLDPATFLMALTLAGVAMLLWPIGKRAEAE
jgi:hypothetical protein